ncbi:MAG: hypothetical protein KDI19_00815 [Pseudomonadales bacterium]|nr:hypothetical protein [Pseudomonadales bacterium]
MDKQFVAITAALAISVFACSAIAEQAFDVSGSLDYYNDTTSGVTVTDGSFEARVYYAPSSTPVVQSSFFGTTSTFAQTVTRISWHAFDGDGNELASRDVIFATDNGSAFPDDGSTTITVDGTGAQTAAWNLVHQASGISYDSANVSVNDPFGTMLPAVDIYPDPLTLSGYGGSFSFQAYDYSPDVRQQQGQGTITSITAAGSEVADEDGDGVADNQDSCLGSDMSVTVFIDERDSGVENKLLDEGCTLSDLIDSAIDDDKPLRSSLRDVLGLVHALRHEHIISRHEAERLAWTAARAAKSHRKHHRKWWKKSHHKVAARHVCLRYTGHGRH